MEFPDGLGGRYIKLPKRFTLGRRAMHVIWHRNKQNQATLRSLIKDSERNCIRHLPWTCAFWTQTVGQPVCMVGTDMDDVFVSDISARHNLPLC